MERRWEELDVDCLAPIFARLAMEEKVVSLPFVCKSWSKASLDPLCWRCLDFSSLDFWQFDSFAGRFDSQYSGRCRLSFLSLFKLALRRSQGSTTELFLPPPHSEAMFDHLALCDDIPEEDPEVVEKNYCLLNKVISYDAMYTELEVRIPVMVANLSNLETLKVQGKLQCFEETLAAIKEHCPRFQYLMISGTCPLVNLILREEETKAIVTLLPMLKRLSLYRVFVDKKCLMSLLDGCKELEELRMASFTRSLRVLIGDCDDLVKRAAKIRTFVDKNPTFEKVYNDLFKLHPYTGDVISFKELL